MSKKVVKRCCVCTQKIEPRYPSEIKQTCSRPCLLFFKNYIERKNGAKEMNARQRKIVLVLKEYWDTWGAAPPIAHLCKLAQVSEVFMREDLNVLRDLGWLHIVNGGYGRLEANLTRKAENVLPRLRELA